MITVYAFNGRTVFRIARHKKDKRRYADKRCSSLPLAYKCVTEGLTHAINPLTAVRACAIVVCLLSRKRYKQPKTIDKQPNNRLGLNTPFRFKVRAFRSF